MYLLAVSNPIMNLRGNESISAVKGVYQGCSMSPFLFALGALPLLRDLNTTGVIAPFYADDGLIIGTAPQLLHAPKRLQSTIDFMHADGSLSYSRTNVTGLTLRVDKSSLTSFGQGHVETVQDNVQSFLQTTSNRFGIPISQGFIASGVSYGPIRFIEQHMQTLVQHAISDKLDRLRQLNNTHAAYDLLRGCVSHTLVHHLRCSPPALTNYLCEKADSLISDFALEHLGLHLDSLSDKDTWSRPTRLGGAGILSHKHIAPLAFAGSALAHTSSTGTQTS